MAEIILGIAALLGVLFLLCRMINKTVRVFGRDEITDLMSETLSMRMGDFSSRRKR